MPIAEHDTAERLHENINLDTDAAQLLECAASYVDSGWTRTFDAVDADGCEVPPWRADAKCFCMRGAIQRAQLSLGYCIVMHDEDVTYLHDTAPYVSQIRARAYFQLAIAITGHRPDPMQHLPRVVTAFNDNTVENGALAAWTLRQGARRLRLRIKETKRKLS